MEWIVTRPLAFGMQARAPADTTIGNSKTFESDVGGTPGIVGCATELNVVALKAIKVAAQDIGNPIFIVISPLVWLPSFREVALDDARPPPLSSATSTQYLLPAGQPKTSIASASARPSGIVSGPGNAGELFRIAKHAIRRPSHRARFFERSHRSIDFRTAGAKKLRQLALRKAEF